MSRNSKNARLVFQAKQRNRVKGFRGPAKTAAKHGKKNAWWQVGNKTYSEFVKGKKATVAQ